MTENLKLPLRPFHLAFPVSNLESARNFYCKILGCKEGRSDKSWIDINFFGHQLVFHLDTNSALEDVINPVDDHNVPVPHFGIVLSISDWEKLAKKIQDHDMKFIIEPYIRFKGQAGEQATMFFKDPNGINLEFKAFKNDEMLFAQ